MWKQIAVRFRDYDYHLIFAGTNEVQDGTLADGSSYKDEAFVSQNMLLKTFVEAVRSTGGRNAYRYLAVQSFNTNIGLLDKLNLPEDNVKGRMFVECHCYTPWAFCGLTEYANWVGDAGNMYLWGRYRTDTYDNPYYRESQLEGEKIGRASCRERV